MRDNPESLAWRILLASFSVFLMICGATAYGVYWYLFQSTVPMEVKITPSRGTVRVFQPLTQEERGLAEPRTDIQPEFEILTDSSQGILTFFDPSTGEAVASAVVLSDSRLSLVRATAPRFRFNTEPYRIELESDIGRSEILILVQEPGAVLATIASPQAVVRMDEEGHYLINVTSERTRITANEGQTVVFDRINNEGILVTTDHRTVVDRIPGELALFEAEGSLLENNRFREDLDEGWELDTVGEPFGTSGNGYTGIAQGRPVVVLDRAQENWPDTLLSHGEVSLDQVVDMDVSNFATLELRATFYIEEQSLSACGLDASECPLMVRINYTDVLGVERLYIQGFYAYRDPAIDYPLACDTCRIEHIRINADAWYTFRSGDLLALLPSDQKPQTIDSVRVYASGHAFEVWVSELDLKGTR